MRLRWLWHTAEMVLKQYCKKAVQEFGKAVLRACLPQTCLLKLNVLEECSARYLICSWAPFRLRSS